MIKSKYNLFSLGKSRKAQVEMIGLVIIVILITLGMLFMAWFALKEEPTKKIFTRKGLAVSTMSALTKTTITAPGCEGLELEGGLIEDCAEGTKFNSYDYYCNGVNSCEYLQQLVPQLLEETLGQWNKRYQFTSTLSTGDILLDIASERGNCFKRERDTSRGFPLNTQVGIVESVLLICE